MSKIPAEIDTGFKIPEPILWALDAPVENVMISEIAHNLDILYLESEGTDDWNLTINMLIRNFEKEHHHADQVNAVDLAFPIELYSYNDKWIILDGVHRLTKTIMGGKKSLNARKHTRESLGTLIDEYSFIR